MPIYGQQYYTIFQVAQTLDLTEEEVQGMIDGASLKALRIGPDLMVLGKHLEPLINAFRLDDVDFQDGPDGDALIVLPPTREILLVTSRFSELISRRDVSQRDLLALGDREFEALTAELWERFGYAVELTGKTRDGGRDIIAVLNAETQLRILIECKRYTPPKPVDVTIVRALYGVKTDERATKAIIATTSELTGPAQQFVDRHTWELEARNYKGVLDWIDLARQKSRI